MDLWTLILPTLLPPLVDGVRGLFARFSQGKGAQPQNVDERIKLMMAEVGKLEALAKLDTPTGNISRWVADLRGSFRYLAVSSIVLSTLAGVFMDIDSEMLRVLLDLTGASMSFIIGERMYFGLKGAGK